MAGDHAPLAVIGAGPGGYVAALRAADLGLDVTLIDAEERPGGTCLLRGCIPSKALLHAAHTIDRARDAAGFGISFGEPQIDREQLAARVEEIVDGLATGVASLLDARGVRRIRARARFEDSTTLALAGDDAPARLRFDHALVATGSRPLVPPPLQADDARVVDSRGALRLPSIPERMLVVGGGYIGLELGQVYAALGARVHVVEATGGLLPGVDRDLVEPLQERLADRFAAIWLSTRVTALEPLDDAVRARLEGPGVAPDQRFDLVLVAVGRRPHLDGLGLERTNVRIDDDGFVVTDAAGRTDDPHVLAIGDAAGEPMLAHEASAAARVAVEALVHPDVRHAPRAVPAVVFTDPAIAWCGLTEERARRDGREVEVTRFPWRYSGRARTLGRTDGVTKLVCEPGSGRLLGAGIAGPDAGELIAEAVLAVELGATARDLTLSIHPHPTLSETLAEAAELHGGRPIHAPPGDATR